MNTQGSGCARMRGRYSVACAMLLLIGLLGFGSAQAAVTVVSVPVTFDVVNQNRSLVPCLADGKHYQVHGHLVGPSSALNTATPGALTLYLHGIGWGEFYWHFTAVPSLDYASQMAALGHVSLVYDQIGYGASGRPAGLANCYGGEATVVRQIVADLRAGTYVAQGRAAPKFARVALASQQAAALVAQPDAYSFKDIDALIVTSFADLPAAFKPAFLLQSVPFFAACATGGQRSDGTSGPYFYEPFPVSDGTFERNSFTNADATVIAKAVALRGRSACGEALSAFQTVGIDELQLILRSVHVPVLLVNGLEDAYFMQPLGGNTQKLLYTGSGDVSAEFIANAGQALALERSAGDFRNVMHNWLAARGF